MSEQTFLLAHAGHVKRFVNWLLQLTFRPGQRWLVRVEKYSERRTIDQNAKIRAIDREIAAFTGDDPDDMHEILLARRFGTERIELGGGKFMERPARRTSQLSKQEAADYITWLQAFAARECGLELR